MDRQAYDTPACRILSQGLQSGQSVLADKAYDADWIRAMIYEQSAQVCIHSKENGEESPSCKNHGVP